MDKSLSRVQQNKRSTVASDWSTWTRACAGPCGKAMPACEFGKNRHGGYYSICPLCRDTRHVRELYVEQEKQVTLAVKKLVAAALKKPKPLPDMEDICRDVMEALGGQKEFVKRWAESIKDTDSGSKTSIDAHNGFARTMQATKAQQSRDMELSQVSPEKLESAILDFMEKMNDDETVELETETEAIEHESPGDGG